MGLRLPSFASSATIVPRPRQVARHGGCSRSTLRLTLLLSVAVRVGLMDGRRVAVGVWCESDDGLIRMEAERENIVLGLEQEGMVVAGLDLHRGHPPEGREETTTAANHRLDLQL